MNKDRELHQAVMTYRLKLLAELQSAPAGANAVLADLHDRVVLLNLLDRESAMILSAAGSTAE